MREAKANQLGEELGEEKDQELGEEKNQELGEELVPCPGPILRAVAKILIER